MAENENVDTSSDVAAETSQETTEATEVASVEAAPDVAAESEVTDESRTGFAEKGLRAGDTCVCPDGRTGTVHGFDAGLICIPNQDQEVQG